MKVMLLVWTIFFSLVSTCQASPLQDFTQGNTALEINWRPNVEFRHTPENSLPTGIEFSLSHGLGDKTAVEYRHISGESFSKSVDTFHNTELNLLYKLDNNIQLYSGYSATSVRVKATNLLLEKNQMQFGLIGIKPLSKKTTLYAIAGGGNNLVNIEAGLSYLLSPGLELNATYRHLSVENMVPAKTKAHIRGVGLGIGYKF